MTRPRVSHRVVCWNVQRDRALDRALGEIRDLCRRADVMLLQETQGYARHIKIPGWQVLAVDGHERDETCILVRDHLEVGTHGPRQVTTRGWRTVRGGTTPPKWNQRAEVDGIEYVSVHTPPTVQTARMHVHSPARWRAYREQVANIKPGRRAVVAGDWNLTPRSPFGAWLKRRMVDKGLQRHTSGHGTHGKREIDYLFARGVRVGPVRVLPKLGSDHRPISFTVTA